MVEAGDRFGLSLVLLLDDVACCRNWAIRDDSCAWRAGGKTAAVEEKVTAGRGVTKGVARDTAMLSLENGRLLCWGCNVAGLVDMGTLAGECEFVCIASCKRFAITALVPLVTRWRDERWSRRTSAGNRVSCETEQFEMSLDSTVDDDERLVFGIAVQTLSTSDCSRSEAKHWLYFCYARGMNIIP